MICKSMDIWTITKATDKETADLFLNHLLSSNECNGLNHRGKENGTDLLQDHTISVARMLIPLRSGDQIAFPIMKLEQEILLNGIDWCHGKGCEQLLLKHSFPSFAFSHCAECTLSTDSQLLLDLPNTLKVAYIFLILMPSLGQLSFKSALCWIPASPLPKWRRQCPSSLHYN